MFTRRRQVVPGAGVRFMDENDKSTDRRAHPRKKMLKPAYIVYQDGNCVMDCVVSDLSEGGARIKPADIFACPDSFELQIKGEFARRCKVVQKSESGMGVKFLD